jgi:DNA-binding NtrC family response regulator
MTALNLRNAREAVQRKFFDIVLLDVMLPDGSGLELLHEIDPAADTRIVIMTGHPTVDVAVDSLRARAADFLVKPVEPRQLLNCLDSIQRALARATVITPSAGPEPTFDQFVGNSPAMLEIYRLIERVAPSRANVMIHGGSGTGKELVAQAIHTYSERRNQPFLGLNCGAISAELIGSELFGHERGSFTGATRQHFGHFERANGGTLFLDEITEMPLELQVQLLRVLETGKLMRIGGDLEIDVNVRITTATNRAPQQAISLGQFREDLYFRLAVFPIHMPSLDEREGDVRLLASYFLIQLNREEKTHKRFTESALAWLEQQRWPGNVRELKNAVQHAFIMAEEEISENNFPKSKMVSSQKTTAFDGGLNITIGSTPIDEAERQLIYATLEHYKGNKPKTAEVLGISLKTLYNRLNQYEKKNLSLSANDSQTSFNN